MASISSVSGTNSANSIYGNRNVLSGLASGMDTESMIENAVSGIKARIASLGQKRTKVEWQQESYRSIISKMAGFSNKYTSFRSQTNLLSNAFFNNAVKTTANGANASKVSASGKTSSDVVINRVRQLASAARYTVSGSLLGGSSGQPTAVADGSINLNNSMDLSTIAGTMTLKYGSQTIDLEFGELETFQNAEELAEAIQKKLSEQKVVLTSGAQKAADEMIGVEVNGNSISFVDKSTAGNSVYISSASANMKEKLGIDTSADAKQSSFSVSDFSALKTQKTASEYLSDKTMSITLDGVTKSINMPTQEDLNAYLGDNPGADDNDAYLGVLQEKIDKAFGKVGNDHKLTVSAVVDGDAGAFKLKFSAQEGSVFSISSEVDEAMGFDKGLTSYVNNGKTLGQMGILSNDAALKMDSRYQLKTEGEGDTLKYYYENDAGKKIYTDSDGYHINAEGKKLYSFKLNDVEIGQFTEDTALDTVISSINNNTDAGVKVSYSKITNEFVFTAKETGAGGKVEFGQGLAQKMFGGSVDENGDVLNGSGGKIGSYSAGKDAIFSATINGTELDLTRSSNVVDLDGLSVTLNDTFGYKRKDDGTFEVDGAGNPVEDPAAEKVTFTSKADADTIVEAIKNMVKDYNEMATEIKKAYSTMPAEKSATKHTRYEPLTEEDKAEMSDSAIEAYEEKAKQGILFADSNLSSLYSKLRTAISPSGNDGALLRSIGISTEYSEGLTTLTLDESKLRDALAADPDKVRDAFTKSKEGGSATNGLMENLKTTLDNYAGTTGATKGVLIERAGSPLAPTSILKNSLKTIMDNYDKQIDSWQEKLADQVDRYTSKFTQLEKLIAEMNSQSSALMGMMGGGN